MATAKKNNYIDVELEFAEQQLASWKSYIEENPIEKIDDRWGKKEMPKGGYAWVVTATKEQQVKSIQETLERYLKLSAIVKELREKEEAKQVSVRGNQGLTPFESGEI